MKIERSVTLFPEGNISRKVLTQSLVPADECAREFLRAYTEISYEENLADYLEYCHDMKQVTLATGTTDETPMSDNEWRDLKGNGWRLGSLVHWYLYKELCLIKNESLVLGGVLYKDEVFNQWTPTIKNRGKVFGASTNEISLKRYFEPMFRKHTKMLLIKIERKQEKKSE